MSKMLQTLYFIILNYTHLNPVLKMFSLINNLKIYLFNIHTHILIYKYIHIYMYLLIILSNSNKTITVNKGSTDDGVFRSFPF